MSRVELFSNAIAQTMTERHYGSIIFESGKMPRGFWVAVRKHLPAGMSWPTYLNSLSTYYGRHKAQIVALIAKGVTPSPLLSVEQGQQVERIQQVIPNNLEDMIDKAISKRFPHYQDNECNRYNEQAHFELVPEPQAMRGKGKGRKLNRDFERLSVAVDKYLLTLFEEEKERLRIPASRLLDSILWNHYGKPAIKPKV